MKFAEELSFYFFNEFLTLLNPMFSRSTCSAETNAIISSRESGTFFVNASNWTSANGANRIRNLPLKLFHIHAHILTCLTLVSIGRYFIYTTRKGRLVHSTLFFWHVTWALPTSFCILPPQSCDMWSLGVVIYIMLCGYPPFYSEVPRKQLSQGMKRRIMAGEYDYPEKEWSKISPEAKEVIARYVTLTIWIEP